MKTTVTITFSENSHVRRDVFESLAAADAHLRRASHFAPTPEQGGYDKTAFVLKIGEVEHEGCLDLTSVDHSIRAHVQQYHEFMAGDSERAQKLHRIMGVRGEDVEAMKASSRAFLALLAQAE